jgi:flagellar hook-basal body complex protein FliE
MNITGIQPTNSLLTLTKTQNTSTSNSFENMLNQYIQQADGAVKDFENKSISLAKGDNIDLHEVTIAAQKASIAVQLTTQIRDKAVEAYQEMMRMQI